MIEERIPSASPKLDTFGECFRAIQQRDIENEFLRKQNKELQEENAELKEKVREQSERISELTQELDDLINRFG